MENLRSNIDFVVEKDSKTGNKNYKSRIARDNYLYIEDRAMDWKILPETAKIGDYDCVARFYGAYRIFYAAVGSG